MVILRELRPNDAALMLEWMHDIEINKAFKRNFCDATIENAKSFISQSRIPDVLYEGASVHFAIANEEDEYLGTVSLKNVSIKNMNAEYAIVLRGGCRGKGFGADATKQMLYKAFVIYGLHRVYLSVYANNVSAIKFYSRCGFICEGEFREHFVVGEDKYSSWKWYSMLANEYADLYIREKGDVIT